MVRESTATLGTTSVVLMLAVLVWFNYPAVLPQILDEWQLTGLEAGIVLAAFQTGYLLVVVPAGMLADRYSERWLIAVGTAGTGFASLAFAVGARGFLTGTVLRFVAGLFMAGVYVPGMRFVSSWFRSETRGRALGVYVGAYSTSSGISFLASSWIVDAVDWRTAIAVTSVGALLAAPLMLVLTNDPPGMRDPSLERSNPVGQREQSDGDSAELYSASSRAAPGDDNFGSQFAVFGNRKYLLAVSTYTWHAWELFGVRSWLLVFLVTVPAVTGSDSAIGAGGLMAIVMLAGGPGNLLGGWLSDYVGRLATVGVALTISATISVSLGFLEWLPLPALVALLLMYGLALTADSAPTSTMITEVVDDRMRGTALSIQSLIGFAGTAASPVVFGLALDWSGYTVAFSTLAAAAGFGLLSVAALHRSTIRD